MPHLLTTPHPWGRTTACFAIGQVVLVLAYALAIGTGQVPAAGVLFVLSRLGSLAVTAWAVLSLRTADRGAWTWILGAVATWSVLDVGVGIATSLGHGIGSWSTASLMPALGYALMVVGVLRLARRAGLIGGQSVLVESAAAALAFLLDWWVVVGVDVLAPTDHHEDPATLLANLYPLGDVLLIGAGVVLLNSTGAGRPGRRFLGMSFAAAVVGDLLFAVSQGTGHVGATRTFPVMFMVQFALLAAAALLEHSPTRPTEHDRRRVVSLTAVYGIVGSTVLPLVLLALRSRYAPVSPALAGGVLLALLGLMALTTSRLRALVATIDEQASRLAQVSRTDELTGLPNRRAGSRIMTQACAEPGAQVTLAILDLDHFKRVNDTLGHQHGDRLLAACGARWREALPEGATLYRHGGEEFVVVLPGHDADTANRVIEGLRASTPHGTTFSAGVTAVAEGEDPHAALDRADRMLYLAKAAGRDTTRTG